MTTLHMTTHDLLNLQRRVRVFGHYVTRIIQHGCSNGYCRMVKRTGGMHTNGGCNCMRRLSEFSLELAQASDSLAPFVGMAPLDEPLETSEQEISQWGA